MTLQSTTKSNSDGIKNWNEFFAQRKWMRRAQFAFGGLPVLGAFLLADITFLSMPLVNPTQEILGMNPIVAAGLGTTIGGFGSFLAGRTLFSTLWRRIRPQDSAQLDKVCRIVWLQSFYH